MSDETGAIAASVSLRVCGLDEAGRGPLAGPLVAAAVVFPVNAVFHSEAPRLGLRDSKQLSARQRSILAAEIRSFAEVVQVEVVSVEDINAQGIGWANRAAFERLIMNIDADLYIVDGRLKLSNLGRRAARVRSVVRADQSEPIVSAASIVAKVFRDRLMDDLHLQFPVYGWDHNRGYGTRAHIASLRQHGPSVHHRQQFIQTALARFAPHLPGFEEPNNDP